MKFSFSVRLDERWRLKRFSFFGELTFVFAFDRRDRVCMNLLGVKVVSVDIEYGWGLLADFGCLELPKLL